MRARLLLRAVQDVGPSSEQSLVGRPLARASADHRRAFEQYLAAFRQAKDDAEAWWEAMIEAEAERGTGGEKAAEERLRERFPYGYAVDKKIIAAIRFHWLLCCSLNDRAPEPERAAPQDFAVSWLIDEGEQALAELVAALPFWPMGMDEDGHWI